MSPPKRIPRLAEIADGVGKVRFVGECEACGHTSEIQPSYEDLEKARITPRDQIQAINILAKYGLGRDRGVPRDKIAAFVQELGEHMHDVLGEKCEKGEADELAEEIIRRWKRAARERMG